MATAQIKDKSTGEVIGQVMTNRSLTFDQTMRLAGFRWLTEEFDGVECDGWYDDKNTLWDEENAELEYC